MSIIDEWFKDIPQQFLGKKNIEVLVKAFARQLQAVEQVFKDLNTKTDLNNAVGKNLDYVGTIIPLSRKEAGELAGIGVTEPVISDERYRQYLRYKNLVNTNDCTYYDLMAGMEFCCNEVVHYIEDPAYPATIIFETIKELGKADNTLFRRDLCIRPSGVNVFLRKRYYDNFIVPVKYKNAIHFRTGFYPRYNLAFLNLDNTWKLDGSLLNGYNGDSRLDFYPVSMRLQVPVKEQMDTGQRLRLISGAREEIRLSARYKIRTEARASPEAAEQFTIKTDVKEQSSAGPVQILNLNVLDNEWKLDSSRKLNGGLTIL